MSDLIGYTRCNVRGCTEVAEFKQDKRKKLFMNCPVHGRAPGSTNEAQAEFQKMLDAGEVFSSRDDVQIVEIHPGQAHAKPETKPETEKPQVIENTSDNSEVPEKTGKGKRIAAAGLILTITGAIAAWMLKKQKQQTT